MRYLVSCILALPLLSSCTVIEEQYYDRGYYAPPPRVEVVPNNPNRHYHEYHQQYHAQNGYVSGPRGRVYHGHGDARGNAVIINPRTPQAQVEVQQNIHGHGSNNGTVHGHGSNKGNVHGHDSNNGNIRRHPITDGNGVVTHPQQNGSETDDQKNVHGHS